jgi:TolB protein
MLLSTLLVPSASSSAVSAVASGITFSRAGNLDLIGPAGRSTVLLRARGVYSYYDPAWSRDHRRLAYTRWIQPTGLPAAQIGIRTGRAAPKYIDLGRSIIQTHPAWAPDGRRLVGVAHEYGNGGTLHIIDIHTGKSRVLLKTPFLEIVDNEPAWSPNANRIAFVRADNEDENSPSTLYVIDQDGTDLRQLTTTDAHNPSWSPDGKQIVYDDGNDLLVIDANNKTRRQLTSARARERDPSWSPNGRWIAYNRSGGVWVIDPNGNHAQRLIKNAVEPAWK